MGLRFAHTEHRACSFCDKIFNEIYDARDRQDRMEKIQITIKHLNYIHKIRTNKSTESVVKVFAI